MVNQLELRLGGYDYGEGLRIGWINYMFKRWISKFMSS